MYYYSYFIDDRSQFTTTESFFHLPSGLALFLTILHAV